MSRPVRARVILGHVVDALAALPDRSVHCVVTSPPYWGLRDYGTAAWIGGDAGCLHLNVAGSLTYGERKRKWQHANNGEMLAAARAGETTVVPPSAEESLAGPYRQKPMYPAGGAVCADCGAVRVEPTVWGGDPDCPHQWGEIVQPTANSMDHSMAGPTLNPHSATRHPKLSAMCALCGAWRGALGLEPTFEMYVAHIVEAMEQVRRVLRDDGVCWLNMGDCYATGGGLVGEWPGGGGQGERWRGYRGTHPEDAATAMGRSRNAARGLNTVDPKARKGIQAVGPITQPNRMPQPGRKPKDLVGMPWLVALALQAAGWWLRMDVVWHKPNPMPESVRDRPTRAHEYVFLLTKSERYFYDADAIREPFSEGTYRRVLQASFDGQEGGPKDYGRSGVDPSRSARRGLENLAPKVRQAALGGGNLPEPQPGLPWNAPGQNSREFVDRDPVHLASGGKQARDKTAATPHLGGRRQAPEPGEPNAFHPLGRNKRSVWTIPTQPYPEAHFATFPEALVLPCVQAGTSERGACPDCGKPWVRVTAATGGTTGRDWNAHARGDADLLIGHTKDAVAKRAAVDGSYARFDLGWRPGCVCRAPAELGLRPDDFDVILSPEGGGGDWDEAVERAEMEDLEDPSFVVGRAGFARPRRPDEGFRPITRYEQRKYAEQLRAAPPAARRAMQDAADAAGPEAFAHYLRTDDAGARPIPEPLLEEWTAAGWLVPVDLPDWTAWAPEPVPCTVLDPFAGSGTALLVAAKNGRDSVGIELKPDYLRLILDRLAPMEADLLTPVAVEVQKAPPWAGRWEEGGGQDEDRGAQA